jgi:riboflavin synthase
MDQRSREHALNVVKMLSRPEKMIKEAGTGQRQGFEDVGPARM